MYSESCEQQCLVCLLAEMLVNLAEMLVNLAENKTQSDQMRAFLWIRSNPLGSFDPMGQNYGKELISTI